MNVVTFLFIFKILNWPVTWLLYNLVKINKKVLPLAFLVKIIYLLCYPINNISLNHMKITQLYKNYINKYQNEHYFLMTCV